MTRETEQIIDTLLGLAAFAFFMLILTAIVTLCVKLAIFLFTF